MKLRAKPPVFTAVFWGHFNDCDKAQLIQHIIDASGDTQSILAAFFSTSNGINALLSEIDSPASPLPPETLMQAVYTHILAKEEIIKKRTLNDILPMIVTRKRVSNELKLLWIRELWNKHNIVDERPEDFINILILSNIDIELLGLLIQDPAMIGFVDFLITILPGFSQINLDVLIKPLVTKTTEATSIVVLFQPTLLSSLLENGTLFDWLTPPKLSLLYTQYLSAPQENRPSEQLCLNFYAQYMHKMKALMESQERNASDYLDVFLNNMLGSLDFFQSNDATQLAFESLIVSAVRNNMFSRITDTISKQTSDIQQTFLAMLEQTLNATDLTLQDVNNVLDDQCLLLLTSKTHDFDTVIAWLKTRLCSSRAHQRQAVDLLINQGSSVFTLSQTIQLFKLLLDKGQLSLLNLNGLKTLYKVYMSHSFELMHSNPMVMSFYEAYVASLILAIDSANHVAEQYRLHTKDRERNNFLFLCDY